jgi:protease IV
MLRSPRVLPLVRVPARALLAALAIACCSHAQVHAQFHRATDSVAVPVSSIVLGDDAASIDDNPAQLALLPAFSLVYVHAELEHRRTWLGRGDAVSFAVPLIFGVSLGGTLQSIRPGPLAQDGSVFGATRALAGFALGFSPSRRFGAAISARGMTSSDSRFDGLSAIDAALTWRASDRLGVSVIGRDLFASREGFGTGALDLGSSLVLGLRARPAGTSDFVLGADLAFDDASQTAARVGLGLRVPHFGYASALAEIERFGERDETLRILAELSATFGGLTLGAGGIGGDGIDGAGYYGVVRVEGRPRPGVTPRGRILDVELAGLDERGILRASMLLDAARHDPRVAGVLLRPRGSSMGSAYAQELRLLISALRAAGKRVACHLEDASGAEYYACAGSDVVLIDPAGSLRLLGNSSEVLLLGDTLRSAGLRADFVRIGDYKSAPEQLTQGELSEPAREELRELLDDVHGRILQDLGRDLSVDAARVAAIMDDGPQLASQALRDKLVHAAIDESRIREGELAAFDGRSIVDELPERAAQDWGVGPRIGVVVIDGAIIDGESTDIPFLDLHMTGGRTIVRTLESLTSDPSVRAIVIRVDSPGGAVVASDQIWRAVRRARAHKPVVVSMGAVAASGGYYVAAAGDEIWADPSTLTGSIGIFYGKLDVQGLADKLDVGIEVFRRGKRAGADSMFRPFSADERSALAERLRSYYQLFLSRVAEGRKKTVEEVDRVARGRVYSGDAALRLGLVDRLGGFASAVARARVLAGLSDAAEIVIVPRRKQGLIDYVLGDDGARSDGGSALGVASAMPAELRSLLSRIVTMQRLGSGAPLAISPYDARL